MEVTMPEKQKGNPALQRQLEHLLDWNGPDFERKLPVRDSTSPEYLASEILVMALRRPWSADDAELAERIATELLDRWGKYILSAAYKRFRVTAVEMADSHRNQGFLGAPSSTNNWLLSGKRGDMIQEVHLRLWRELKDPAK